MKAKVKIDEDKIQYYTRLRELIILNLVEKLILKIIVLLIYHFVKNKNIINAIMDISYN